jgi:CubicO group peptidase (beta-lactamase class C family)
MRFGVLLALILCTVSTTRADPRTDKIMDLFELQRTKLHIAGLGVVVVRHGQVIVLDVRGMRDVEHQLPVTFDTLFPIGSCTKAFTAMAMGIAQDEGVLSLDDSPHRWLPYFKMRDREADAQVTLRDMLSHRTGLKGYADLAAEPAVLTREEFLRAALGAVPAAPFRASFQYSNAMVTAAGEAVARAYKTSWEKVIETKVFAPLGMTASRASSYKLGNEGTVGYVWDGGAWKARPVTPGLRVLAPAGAIASTPKDMARWLRMLANDGVHDGQRFIREATLRDLTSPHTQINETLSYGLGWAIYDWNGHAVIEHNGGSEGLSALVSFMPDRRAGFVVLANSSETALTRVGNLGAQLWPLILDEPSRTAAPTTPPRSAAPQPAGRGDGSGRTAESLGSMTRGIKELPSATEVIERAIEAAGGRARLARHTAMEFRAVGGYVHQGIDVEIAGTLKGGKQVIDERWRAAGKAIGRVRTYFDGARGAQQTTFGQDEVFEHEALATARRDAVLHPLLEVATLYDSARVDRRAIVDGDETFVLVMTPKVGAPVELFVSAQTGRVVRRDSAGESTRYSDFRKVDGEVVPFASTTSGALGDKVLAVKQLRFGAAVPPRMFGPVAKLTR